MSFGIQPLLPFSFYDRETLLVAEELVGKILWRRFSGEMLAGRIVETEAYLGKTDPSSHAFRGPTPRSAVMFEPPGRAYVYFVYGNHFCFNVVTHHGSAGAVLVRALEPVAGIERMMKRRGIKDILQICSGPGKLAQAMGITKKENGVKLYRSNSRLVIADAPTSGKIFRSPRIGIRLAAGRPYRFTLQGNLFVSKPHPWKVR